MSTDFELRLAPGIAFEKELFALLESRPDIVSVCLNGTEHTHPAFVAMLRQNNSEQAKLVRYAPDGIFLTRKGSRVCHFDAKVAKSIEKDAYETYMKYQQMGCIVYVFVKYDGKIYWQEITQLKLIDGLETVGRYSPEKRLPVEDGWIYPRKSGRHCSSSRMSGTPYREIDFGSMKEFPVERRDAS